MYFMIIDLFNLILISDNQVNCIKEMKDEDLKYIKDIIQSANINFLIGSGLSSPFLNTLGSIEKNISAISENEGIEPSLRKYIIASLFNLYFLNAMYKNKYIFGKYRVLGLGSVIRNYKDFITIFNSLLQRRGSTILNKQINLFTTNIDLFLEKTLEDLGVEFNDGFSGRNTPIYSLGNFNKVLSKRSLHFENESRIPIFNLLKVHGSLNWKYESNRKITYSSSLIFLDKLKKLSSESDFIKIENEDVIKDLIEKAQSKSKKADTNELAINKFIELYEAIPIVNPTKTKFKETVLDLNYYELLRFYSNELEKENSVLFVLGFSMADEHISEMTIRLALSNPTLTILIFAYDEDAKKMIFKNLKSKFRENIKIFSPIPDKKFNLETLNEEIFQPLLDKISKNE